MSTFTANVQDTFGTFFADLRDQISGMANWSIKHDESAGAAAFVGNDYFVCTTPTGEDIKIGHEKGNENNWGLFCDYGPDWNVTNENWDDQFSDTPPDHWSNNILYPVTKDTHCRDTDTVRYWIYTKDSLGFGFYVQREQADGDDGDMALSFSKVTEVWDYDSAVQRESDYLWAYGGSNDGDNNSREYRDRMGEGGVRVHGAYGMVNPDENFSNYVWTDAIVEHRDIQNSSGHYPIIGYVEPPILIRDNSGGDIAHRDTVQDSGATDVYTILKRNGCSVGLRMD